MGWAFNGLRIVASAAALILFGFTVGWLGRDRMYATPISSLASSGTQSVVPAGMGAPLTRQWNVEMRDGNGKIVNIFTFNSEAEAKQWIQEWANHSSGLGDSTGVPSPDKF